MNSKNLLQEYCQKNTIKMPEYISSRTSKDTDHCPSWTSTCFVDGKSYVLNITTNTKKSAEITVASIALDGILKKSSHSQEKNATLVEKQIKNIIVSDIENVSFLKQLVSDSTLVIGFACSSYHMIDKYLTGGWHHYPKFVDFSVILSDKHRYNLLTINDKINDLADHYLSVYLCNMVKNGYNKYNLIVVTNDHAGWCTSSLVKHMDESIVVKNYSSLTILKNDFPDVFHQ